MVFGKKAIGALSLAALLVSLPVHADDLGASGRSAKELYEQGVDLTAQGKLQEAEAKFREAWELSQSYDIAANLGEICMQLDKPADAAPFLTFALKNYPASGKQDKREWLEQRLADAKSKVLVLTLSVNVPGAEVRINGKPRGKAPLEGEVFVPAGDCTVEVSAPDYLPWSRKIAAPGGTSQKLDVTLSQPPRSLVPGIALGGAGVVGLAVGIALYVISGEKYEEARGLHDEILADTQNSTSCGALSPNPRCADLKNAAETSDALFAPGVALLIGGSLLTAAGGAYLGLSLAPPAQTSGKGPKLTAVGVRGTGVFVTGSF